MEVDKGENVKFTVADTDTLKEVYIWAPIRLHD